MLKKYIIRSFEGIIDKNAHAVLHLSQPNTFMSHLATLKTEVLFDLNLHLGLHSSVVLTLTAALAPDEKGNIEDNCDNDHKQEMVKAIALGHDKVLLKVAHGK